MIWERVWVVFIYFIKSFMIFIIPVEIYFSLLLIHLLRKQVRLVFKKFWRSILTDWFQIKLMDSHRWSTLMLIEPRTRAHTKKRPINYSKRKKSKHQQCLLHFEHQRVRNKKIYLLFSWKLNLRPNYKTSRQIEPKTAAKTSHRAL